MLKSISNNSSEINDENLKPTNNLLIDKSKEINLKKSKESIYMKRVIKDNLKYHSLSSKVQIKYTQEYLTKHEIYTFELLKYFMILALSKIFENN